MAIKNLRQMTNEGFWEIRIKLNDISVFAFSSKQKVQSTHFPTLLILLPLITKALA